MIERKFRNDYRFVGRVSFKFTYCKLKIGVGFLAIFFCGSSTVTILLSLKILDL